MVSVNDSFNVAKCSVGIQSNDGLKIENDSYRAATKTPNPFNDSTMPHDSFSMKGFENSSPAKNGQYTEIENQFSTVFNPFAADSANDSGWNQTNELNFASNRIEFSPNVEMYASLKNDIENELLTNSSFDDDNIVRSPTKNMKKEIPTDLFKDMANAAFSEFNAGGKTKTRHEFYNKITSFENSDNMKFLLKN